VLKKEKRFHGQAGREKKRHLIISHLLRVQNEQWRLLHLNVTRSQHHVLLVKDLTPAVL